LVVHNHFWDGGGDKADVRQEQNGEKEVHGSVKLRVRANGQDMSRFSSTVSRYMDRNSPEKMGSSSRTSESFMRWNSGTHVRFSDSTLFGHLLKKRTHWKKETQQYSILCTYFKS
jgi:hypothetical protein